MKLFSKLPKAALYWGMSLDNPLLLFDIYRHRFTFVTLENPRVESGLTFVVSFLKVRVNLVIYVDKPFNVLDTARRKMMERVHGKAH